MFNPQPKPEKKKGAKKPSMLNLFLEIWDERPHVSEISGKPLLPKGNMVWNHQFMHILSRGAFPKFKYRKENIMLGLPEEHFYQEKYEAFRIKRDELKELYHKQNKL